MHAHTHRNKHTHSLTHRCRIDEWQGKEYKRRDNNDEVVSVVPQPLKPTIHDSP